MKKLLSILLAALLIVACVGMVGCGVEGKYEFYAIEYEGVEYKIGDEFDGEVITEEMAEKYGIEFAAEGVVKDLKGNVNSIAKWEETDDGIKVITTTPIGEMTTNVKRDGKKLIIEEDGVKIILKKA